jgi:hypothetical protein
MDEPDQRSMKEKIGMHVKEEMISMRRVSKRAEPEFVNV